MKYVLIFFLCANTIAAEYKISDKKGTPNLTLEMDDRWLYLENVLGVPHLFISKTNKPKDSISITPTNLKNLKLNPNKLNKTQKDYQKGRKSWAKKKNVKILNFHSYKFYKINTKDKIHRIGFDYKLDNSIFSEYSYYLECKQSIFHIKSTLLKERSQYNQEILEILKNATCS